MKKYFKYLICTFVIMFTKINVFAANAPFMQTDKVSCGDGLINNLPKIVITLCNTLYTVVMVVIPIILVFLGIIDLMRGMMSQKEDEIKKGRDGFIKRTVMGLVIFLVVIVVKIIVSFLDSGTNSNKIINCVDCIISGECDTQSSSQTSNNNNNNEQMLA